MRKQYALLLAKSTEIRKQSSILRKQYAFLLAKSTEIRKQSSILRKQYALLLTENITMTKQLELKFSPLRLSYPTYCRTISQTELIHADNRDALIPVIMPLGW